MGLIRRILAAFAPSSPAGAIGAESRTWMVRCPAGHERSVAEAGGIRAGAAGNPRRLLRCPQCRSLRWHAVYRGRERDS